MGNLDNIIQNKPPWVKSDFAEIVETAVSSGIFTEDIFFNDRDNFLEYYENAVKTQRITLDTFSLLFDREPDIAEVPFYKVLALACATADIALNRNGVPDNMKPAWLSKWSCPEDDPLWLHASSAQWKLLEVMAQTPPECRIRNIYAYPKDFSYV